MLLSTSRSLVRHLELPSSGFVRRYAVKVDGGLLGDAALAELQQGLVLCDGTRYKSIVACNLHVPSSSWTPPPVLELNLHKSEKLLRKYGKRGRAASPVSSPSSSPVWLQYPAMSSRASELMAALAAADPPPQLAKVPPGATEDGTWVHMELTQGKHNEVRKACAHFNRRVFRLIRLGFGPFSLCGLGCGDLAMVHNTLAHIGK